MNLLLSLLFLSCITAGISGQRNYQTKLGDGKLAERKQHWPHHTSRTLPYSIQSDQRTPKKKISKVNKFFQKLLNEENKLKRTLQKLAKQRVYVQKLIQQEQRKLVRLQTKQKRVIKTTPALQKLEARDRRLIRRENSLRGKIRVVHNKYCPDCSTTTKRTDSAKTPKSTTTVVTTLFVLPRKTVKFVVPEPTMPSTLITTETTRRTRKHNRMAIGPTTSSARTVPSTTIIPSKAPLPSIPSTSRRFATVKSTITSTPLVERNTNLNLNTVTHLKTTVGVSTPTITNIEPTPILRTTMLRTYILSTTPVTVDHSSDVSTDIEEVSTKRTLESSQSKYNSTPATIETTTTIKTDAETKADAHMKTTMPRKYRLTTTPLTVEHSMAVCTDIEEVSTKKTLKPSKFKLSSTPATAETALTTETIADANIKTTVPWKYTVNHDQTKIKLPVDVPEHSTHAMGEDWSTSTTSIPATAETVEKIADAILKTTLPSRNTVNNDQKMSVFAVSTTKPDHAKYYTITSPVSRSKAYKIVTSPLPITVPVFTTRMHISRIESAQTSILTPAHYTSTTESRTTDSRRVQAGNKTRGQSVSSVVNSYSESENEAVVMYVSVAVSVVLMLILIISVTIYITVFRCRCGKTKDEESSIDSKYQVE